MVIHTGATSSDMSYRTKMTLEYLDDVKAGGVLFVRMEPYMMLADIMPKMVYAGTTLPDVSTSKTSSGNVTADIGTAKDGFGTTGFGFGSAGAGVGTTKDVVGKTKTSIRNAAADVGEATYGVGSATDGVGSATDGVGTATAGVGAEETGNGDTTSSIGNLTVNVSNTSAGGDTSQQQRSKNITINKVSISRCKYRFLQFYCMYSSN